jgi:uncharacterized repeat protein (TIGR03803 family)
MATRIIRKPVLFAAIFLATSAVPALAELPINTLVSFDGTNGRNPFAGLTLSPDGSTLYGTTYQGGVNNDGTVFSVPITGGTPTVLASFNGTNGMNPGVGLTLSGNTLYGTTTYGGAYSHGTVFSVPLAGGTPTVLASFNGTNGNTPNSVLTLLGNTLYGTTWAGGVGNYGTVFSVPITGGVPTVLVSFSGTNGQYPKGNLTLSADDNTLYGTTYYGGAHGGTVFSVPITGGTSTVLASFNGINGANPAGGLTLSPDGNTFYGTTNWGGTNNYGVVFSIPVVGGTPTVLASFEGINGANSVAGLTLSPDGDTLYGTTIQGGAFNFGTIFSVPVTGGIPTVLASFNGTNGNGPEAGLMFSADGTTLYGTTRFGGASGYGTVFSIALPTPEPASLTLLGLGAAALLMRRRNLRH